MSGDTAHSSEVNRIRQSLDLVRLEAWMNDHVPGFRGPVSAEQFSGGQSNPTYRLLTPSATYVLRSKPPGQLLKSAHAVDREFRVTSALAQADYPVAHPLALCADESVIGRWFYVMNLVEGRIFWNSTFPGISAEDKPAYFAAMNEAIARLHAFDYLGGGLANYGRASGFIERQIALWTRQYCSDSDAGRVDAIDQLIDWLPRHVPQNEDISLVHGDFRVDNMIFHPSEPVVLAVLDWELSTLGNPLADFAYHLMMYHLPPQCPGGMLGENLASMHIPSADDYVVSYCRRTERLGIENLNFYLAFSMFRFAAIVHGIKGRLVRGNAVSPDAGRLVDQLEAIANLAAGQMDQKVARP
jgi:aminoglycoside phosphotransferase (APT) family kinase protein